MDNIPECPAWSIDLWISPILRGKVHHILLEHDGIPQGIDFAIVYAHFPTHLNPSWY